MGRIDRTALALIAGLSTLAALPAMAQDGQPSFPSISVSIPFEVQNDLNYHSEDRTAEHNQLYPTIEPEVTVQFTPEISIFAHGVLEPMRDPGPREDRSFEDLGMYIEDLYAKYDTGVFSVQGGKFTPNFGIAWDAAPGVYGTDVAEANYEFSERIGVGGSVTFGGGQTGMHTLSASTFFSDNSFLRESIGRGRSPVTQGRADGGVSNTEDLSSFAVALDGTEFEALPGFRYHVGYIHLAEGRTETADQHGFAIGGEYRIELGRDLSFTPLVEFVSFANADGVDSQDRELLTTAGQLAWRNWNLAASYTGRWTDVPGATNTEDTHFQLSAGYAFDFGLSVDIGWTVDETDNIETRTLGVLFAYTLEF